MTRVNTRQTDPNGKLKYFDTAAAGTLNHASLGHHGLRYCGLSRWTWRSWNPNEMLKKVFLVYITKYCKRVKSGLGSINCPRPFHNPYTSFLTPFCVSSSISSFFLSTRMPFTLQTHIRILSCVLCLLLPQWSRMWTALPWRPTTRVLPAWWSSG